MVTFSILGWKGWEQFLSSPHFRTTEINYNQLNKFGDHCVNSIVVFIRHFSLLSHKSQNLKKNLRNIETSLLVLFFLCINEHTQKKDNRAILWNNHSLWTKFHERFFVFEVNFYFIFCSGTLLGNQRSRGYWHLLCDWLCVLIIGQVLFKSSWNHCLSRPWHSSDINSECHTWWQGLSPKPFLSH